MNHARNEMNDLLNLMCDAHRNWLIQKTKAEQYDVSGDLIARDEAENHAEYWATEYQCYLYNYNNAFKRYLYEKENDEGEDY